MILINKDGSVTEIDDDNHYNDLNQPILYPRRREKVKKICLDNVKTEALTWADIQFLKQAQAWEKATGRSMKIPARIKRCINS